MDSEEVITDPVGPNTELQVTQNGDPSPISNGILDSPSKENDLSSCKTDKPSGDPESSNSSTQPKTKSLKSRKKDDCNVQHVLRALNSLTTPEEKLAAMCKKYADLFDENRKLQTNVKQFQKQMATLIKEKDQVRTDLAKSVLTRSRLESLCREWQRQNKAIKEECFQKMREEEEKRKEVSAKFQLTLNEITELMKQDSDKTMKLRDDNIDMTTKLKSIYEQYDIREQQIEKMAKQMALESQLYEAKLSKMEMEAAAEKEVLLREKQQLLMTLTEYQARLQEYQNIELALRNQVALYNNKYEEFEKSLTRSNKMFGGFKEEMENMSDKIIKLERETAAWKQRWEKTQNALLEMASEKQKSDQEIVIAAKQMATLHKLCRTLQSERTQLLAKLKQNNISTSTNETEESNTDETSTNANLEPVASDNVDEKSKKSSEVTSKKVEEPSSGTEERNIDSECENEIKTNPSENTISNSLGSTDNETLVNEMSNFKISDNPVTSNSGANSIANVVDTNDQFIDNHVVEDVEPANVSIDNDTSIQNDSIVESAENSLSLDQSVCELKQFPFPQTDTFSFTYNGNILNELKCNQDQSKNFINEVCCGENSQAFITPSFGIGTDDKQNGENSQKFVLKKATHSSKRKVSPKKKHKK